MFEVGSRRAGFSPSQQIASSFTRCSLGRGQIGLDFRLRCLHEIAVLLVLLSFRPSVIVSGSAYPLAPPFGLECLISLADSMTYYAFC